MAVSHHMESIEKKVYLVIIQIFQFFIAGGPSLSEKLEVRVCSEEFCFD